MAPPVDQKHFHFGVWNSRPASYFRLPRRRRRTTYLFLALVIAICYLLIIPATTWSTFGGTNFESNPPLFSIRFPNLYASLSQVVGNSGKRKWNRNVVFVAANLSSASKLAGVACEMAHYGRSNVHMAFMGFDTLNLDVFRRINGLPATHAMHGCRVYFHDARPEFAERLPVHRKQLAVKSAFRHINKFMHPQAILMYPAHEEEWFMDLAKEKAKQLESVLIELPNEVMDDVNWITRLDSGSLNAWHKPSLEVVIHADMRIGNLERLLKSLQHAYYPSREHRPKRITIILDPQSAIHSTTRDFLQRYKFPSELGISIQRPLIWNKNNPLAATVGFVESFYTFSDHHSVLFLDPNAVVSKWYYHYLLFATLKYRYSCFQGIDTRTLFGISLESPASYLDGTKPFSVDGLEYTPFLYPSPVSRAVLFFPRHWYEFHSYVSHKLWLHPKVGSRNATDTTPPLKLADAFADSWQAHFVELVRARGYMMLYPSFKETIAKLPSPVPLGTSTKAALANGVMEGKFFELLPNGDFPDWNKIPLKDVWGWPVSISMFETSAMQYRLAISTCKVIRYAKDFEVDDLFCSKEDNDL